MLARRLVLAVPLVGLGCGAPDLPSDLGDQPEDLVRLVDSPALVHLADALDGPGDTTVEDLFRDRPGYARAPDPSEWLAQIEADHDALPPLADSVPLRVLTFNTGLLDRWYPFTTVRVPHVDERRERAPAVLLDGEWDVLLLQEVWETPDVETFAREAERRGYLLYAGSDERHEEHGLLVLVREALVDPDGPDERAEHTFELQRGIERFPGPGIERGFLSWTFRHAPTGVVLHLFDAHTTAFPELSPIRDSQVRHLGLAARAVPDDEVALVAGDLNAGPYYPEDEFGSVGGERVHGWWRNAQAHALLMHYGEVFDVLAAIGAARDVELMDQLPPFGPVYLEEPLGDERRCESLGGVFTATDCNSLYREQYMGTEYPARLDHMMLRDPSGLVRVDDGGVEYDELQREGWELSDHYGIGAVLWVRR
ncbi:MAG: endonuclease/exonuclease/phosphatase family protein [Myxococcales bacterium]|nr:endonuclease/exonuclease/phosphatase family protein [Myxococcales bacterium]